MRKNTFLAIVLNLVLIPVASLSYAADLESWLKGGENKSAEAPAASSDITDASTVVETKAADPEKPVETNKVTKIISSGSNHSLEQIMYKISRAQSNLESYGSDLNGHGPKAIELLKQALEELKQAK